MCSPLFGSPISLGSPLAFEVAFFGTFGAFRGLSGYCEGGREGEGEREEEKKEVKKEEKARWASVSLAPQESTLCPPVPGTGSVPTQ